MQLGDKGDGSPAARDEAKRRYAHLNAHHIPDIIRYSQPTTLYEVKCFAIHTLQPALGNGSVAGGGAASADDGHFIAFGSTLERARTLVLGTAAMGAPTDRPLDRTTGVGRVAEADGQYADALRRGLSVILLLIESTGAFSSDLPCPPPPRPCDVCVRHLRRRHHCLRRIARIASGFRLPPCCCHL